MKLLVLWLISIDLGVARPGFPAATFLDDPPPRPSWDPGCIDADCKAQQNEDDREAKLREAAELADRSEHHKQQAERFETEGNSAAASGAKALSLDYEEEVKQIVDEFKNIGTQDL